MTDRNRWKNVDPWDRIMSKVVHGETHSDGLCCWVYTGSVNRNGYGRVWLHGQPMQVYRAIWILSGRPDIEDGQEFDHLCKNPSCVRPEHLEPVSRRENLLRGDTFAARHARQTHCKRGHEFTPENTRISKRGERMCRACHRARRYAGKHGLDFESYARSLPVDHKGGHGKSPHPNMDELGDRVRSLVGDRI